MKKNFSALCFTLVITVAAFLSCSTASLAAASGKLDYPTKPVQIVVGWGAGGGTDVFARAIAQPASKIMGVPINVVNMDGASGAIAGDYVTKQPADGYTIWAMGSNYPINVAMSKTPHGLKDYIPIARVQHDTGSIQVAQKSPFKTIGDLIAYAKAHPHKLTIGGTGSGSFDNVVVAKFAQAAGIKVAYVPFSSAGEMHSALLGGHIMAQEEEFGPVVKLIESHSIRVLMAFTDHKIAQFPNVPISVDKGIKVTDGIWRGLMVKKGTPKAIVDYLTKTFHKAYEAPSYQAVAKANLLDIRPGWLAGPAFDAFVQNDIDGYQTVLKQLGYIK